MQEIWTNSLLPKALKSCPKANKLSNLVTLPFTYLPTRYSIKNWKNENDAKVSSKFCQTFLKFAKVAKLTRIWSHWQMSEIAIMNEIRSSTNDVKRTNRLMTSLVAKINWRAFNGATTTFE